MKLKDAGKTIKMYPEVGMLAKPEGETKIYQYLCFTEGQLPEISDWKVGEKYKLVIEVEQKRVFVTEEGDDKTVKAEFDVLSVGAYEDDEDEAEKVTREKLKVK